MLIKITDAISSSSSFFFGWMDMQELSELHGINLPPRWSFHHERATERPSTQDMMTMSDNDELFDW